MYINEINSSVNVLFCITNYINLKVNDVPKEMNDFVTYCKLNIALNDFYKIYKYVF